jgi:hypothetical protein
MSKQIRVLIVGLACFLLLSAAAAVFILEWNAPPHAFALDISGQPGRRVIGTIEVDGVAQPVSGSLPARFEYSGNRFSFEVTTLDGEPGEQITVKSMLDGELQCSCTAGGAEGSSAEQGRFVWKSRYAGIGGMGPERIQQLRQEAGPPKE